MDKKTQSKTQIRFFSDNAIKNCVLIRSKDD